MNEEINKALKVLREGGIILYPTDTIWGIGCDATNEQAVERIYKIKKREDSKSMLILLDDAVKLGKYIREIPAVANDIFDLSTSPTTIILPDAINLAKNLIAEDGSIGIRITNEEFSHQLIRKLNRPLVSTSANISGTKSPLFFGEIDDEIKNAVDYVVDWRQDEKEPAQPSSILKIELNSEITILRN